MEQFERLIPLLGEGGLEKLKSSHVAVFGIGGVGSYVVEALARSGVGALSIIDGDNVSKSNINRQLVALHSTIGAPKVEVAKQRLLDINPNIKMHTYNLFVNEDTIDTIDFNFFDYVIDAIDNTTSKILIIKKAKDNNIPIISSMGAGNKKDPLKFKIADISKTNTCPLARVIRKELTKSNVENVKVLFSTESPIIRSGETIYSLSYVPGVAGLLIAGETIFDLIK